MDINTSNSPENNEQQLITNFLKSNDEQIISIITELKKTNDFVLLPTIIELLFSGRSDNLKKAVVDYISDIKSKEAVPIIVEKLESSFPIKNVSLLVTCCWQSRLDFSNHMDIFFDILINGNYLTAFEAFTVIENSMNELSVEKISSHIAQVKKSIVKSDRDKQLLLLEMVSILEKAKREVQ